MLLNMCYCMVVLAEKGAIPSLRSHGAESGEATSGWFRFQAQLLKLKHWHCQPEPERHWHDFDRDY